MYPRRRIEREYRHLLEAENPQYSMDFPQLCTYSNGHSFAIREIKKNVYKITELLPSG